MASLRTEITEIVTGLGMLPLGSIEEALQGRPAAMVGVSDNHYDRLSEALRNPPNRGLFENAVGEREGLRSSQGRTARPHASQGRLERTSPAARLRADPRGSASGLRVSGKLQIRLQTAPQRLTLSPV